MPPFGRRCHYLVLTFQEHFRSCVFCDILYQTSLRNVSFGRYGAENEAQFTLLLRLYIEAPTELRTA